MKENSNCQKCELYKNATPGSVCLKGEGGMQAKLLIFLDSPNAIEDIRHRGMAGEHVQLLKWMLGRMSLKPTDYYIDYILKCLVSGNKTYNKKPDRMEFVEKCSIYRFATLQKLRPKAVIGMGRLCCETFLGNDKVSNYEGTFWNPVEPRVRDFIDKVWITYSPAYALQDPAESVTVYRTLQAAASAAGLKPKLNQNMKPQFYDGYGT